MRTRTEIKRNNIRRANLMVESKQRTNRGNMSTNFGLYNEQCGMEPRDTEGIYMGAPAGTEPTMEDMGISVTCDTCGKTPCGCAGGQACDNCGQSPCGCGGRGQIEMPEMGGSMMDDDDMVMDSKMVMAFMNETYMDDDMNEMDDMDEGCGGGYGDELEEGCGDDTEDYGNIRENYNAVVATPLTDSWGNRYNHILNESKKVTGAKSLMQRMKRVIK
tara:strand:+ start:189 stop:839 length:651 start_codon:yes stop_codon:yes gene_type:complete